MGNKKRYFFGAEKLCRDITLDDLNETDKEVLKTGCCQFLEGRDRSGRSVSMMFGKLMDDPSVRTESLCRIVMYGSQVMTKDERIQLAGYVHVWFAHGMKGDMSKPRELRKAKEMMTVRQCLPSRCV